MEYKIAMFSGTRRLTEAKRVDFDGPIDVLYDITSGTWPVTVDYYGLYTDGVLERHALESPVTYEEPETYRLLLNQPSA